MIQFELPKSINQVCRFRLVELPPNLVSLVEASSSCSIDHCDEPKPSFVIRGRQDDNVIICTDTESYLVREVETSNTLILAHAQPSGQRRCAKFSVADLASSYLELDLTRPRTDRLAELLPLFSGRVEAGDNSFINEEAAFDWLQTEIQASSRELRAALDRLDAFWFRGSYRFFSQSFFAETLRYIILAMDSEDVTFDIVGLGRIKELVVDDGIDDTILAQVLKQVSDTQNPQGYYVISPAKVGRCFGVNALARTMESVPLDNFMKEWRNETPPEFEINLDLLKGHYLIEYQDSTTATIRHFPKSCLPPSAKERLEHLFQIRRKWVREDLLPYVDDLAEDDKKLELLLLKFGRTSREAGVTYYSRRA